MNRYLVIETEETGIYERKDNYLFHVTLRDSITRATGTPSTCSVTISDPCGATLIDAVSMTSDGSGVYHYDYSIPAAAVYGEYEVVLSTTTYTMSKTYNFHIFPWDANHDVRDMTGIGQNKSISDSALNNTIWDAYKEALKNVFVFHDYEQPNYCATINNQCTAIDGSNTTFVTKFPNIADYNGDGVITGYGEQSCGTDVSGIWIDDNGICRESNVTVDDAECGRLTIAQLSGVAIPATAKGIYLKYYVQTANFSDTLFRDAVNYLTAHKVLVRFGELERATAADLNSAQNIKYVSPERMYKEYRRIIRLIRKPAISGVQ